MEKKTVCIVGGGAAGLMAAIHAAREGASVTLLEHNEKPGKKLLATGNGRCNLTNTLQKPDCYRGTCPDFAWDVIQHFDMKQTVGFFSSLGIYPKNRDGYLYPASGQASSVLAVLEMEARYRKVKIKCREHVIDILKHKCEKKWQVKTETWTYAADSVILACGSLASEISGSGRSGYELAEKLGHRIIRPLPALVPLICEGGYFKQWAGVRTEGMISLIADGTPVKSDRGEIQLTEYGVSGIPVFQISRYAARLLDEKVPVSVKIDFFPDHTEEMLVKIIRSRLESCPYKTLKESLYGLFPEKLIQVFTKEKPDLYSLCHRIKNTVLSVKSTKSFRQAQVCSGGISTQEIFSDRMESKICPGIYFAGELVDVDGICGGYNLQWAWSSGAVAGRHAGQRSE